MNNQSLPENNNPQLKDLPSHYNWRPEELNNATPQQWAQIMNITDEDRRIMAELFPEDWKQPGEQLLDNIEELLNTDLTQFTETLYGRRDDDMCLIYPGTHTTFYGAPGSGKTMIAKYVISQAINDGYRCLHIDTDGNFNAITVQNTHELGANRELMTENYSHTQPANWLELELILELATKKPYDLIVIDSVASLQAYLGSDGDNATDYVANVYGRIIKPLLDTGAAVISIDHQSKSEHAKGAAGTVQKTAKADLAFKIIAHGAGLAPKRDGEVYMFLDKDRLGTVKAASIILESGELEAAKFKISASGLNTARLQAPDGSYTPPNQAMKPNSAEAILNALESPMTRAQITKATGLSASTVGSAITRLLQLNQITENNKKLRRVDLTEPF